MSNIKLTPFKKAWNDYKNDANLNEWGRINLTSWLGEHAGFLLDEIERLEIEIARLKAQVATLERETEKAIKESRDGKNISRRRFVRRM